MRKAAPWVRVFVVALAVLIIPAYGLIALAEDGSGPDLSLNFKLIIEPETPAMNVEMWLDRSESEVYYVGDEVGINIRTSRDAYIYLFNINTSGQVYTILPNANDQDNYVRANRTRRVPGSGYSITTDSPGTECIIAVATVSRLNPETSWLKRAMTARLGSESVSSSPEDFLKRLRWTELDTNHRNGYATAVVSFQVVDPLYSLYGDLSITTVPSGASAFLDGKAVGTTPCTVRDVSAGTHELTVVKEGFRTLVTQVNVIARRTEYVTYTLNRLSALQSVYEEELYRSRFTISRERDGFTRSIPAYGGYTGTLYVRPKESYDGKLYKVEILMSLDPLGNTTSLYDLRADSFNVSDEGQTVVRTVGPYTVYITLDSADMYERTSVFSARYFRSITLDVRVTTGTR